MIVSRYHWTLDYVLWGIAWANLQLMIRDSIRVDYKHHEGAPQQLDLNAPNAMNMLIQMAGGK